MRRFLVGLQLLLACVLVWGNNSTSQEPEKQNASVVPAEPNSEGPVKQTVDPWEVTSEEMEESAKGYRELMQKSRSPYQSDSLKQKALDYFNKRSSGAFYRPIEDINVKVKSATGTILAFTQFLVNTNCTKEEGRRKLSNPWDEYRFTDTLYCMAVPKDEQKRLKCRVYMFIDAQTSRSAVFRQDCEPVVFVKNSDTLDIDHLMNFSPLHFPSTF